MSNTYLLVVFTELCSNDTRSSGRSSPTSWRFDTHLSVSSLCWYTSRCICFYIFLYVSICLYMFLYVSIWFYRFLYVVMFLYVFICFYMFLCIYIRWGKYVLYRSFETNIHIWYFVDVNKQSRFVVDMNHEWLVHQKLCQWSWKFKKRMKILKYH